MAMLQLMLSSMMLGAEPVRRILAIVSSGSVCLFSRPVPRAASTKPRLVVSKLKYSAGLAGFCKKISTQESSQLRPLSS